MFTRRTFISQVTLAATGHAFAAPAGAPAQVRSRSQPHTMLYASEGKTVYSYVVDPETAVLRKAGEVAAPETVQYAVLHPRHHTLCVASSNGGPGGRTGDTHYLTSVQVNQESGQLGAERARVALPYRPIHVSMHPDGKFVVVAFNKPAAVQVYRLAGDGTIAGPLTQATTPDVGIFPHQSAFSGDGSTLWVCGRGNDAAPGKPADPGCITEFSFADGALSFVRRTGFPEGVGPRELALHPSKPWAFVALERGNSLGVYELNGSALGQSPLYTLDTRQDQHTRKPRQRTGTAHIHPGGRYGYIVNRADKTGKVDGQDVWLGGENNVAVFAIDRDSGRPTLVQHIDSDGIEPRSFVIDPSGKLLVVGNQSAMVVRREGRVVVVPSSLAVFRIGEDGKLAHVATHPAQSREELIWTGIAQFG